MNRCLIALVLFAITVPSTWAQNAKAGILPKIFAGWEKTSTAETSTDPSKADPVYPDLLKEYGFTDFESAAYTRAGHKMTVKAARFADASGAYGAFTFYKTPEMSPEKIGDRGAASGKHVLFYRGSVLVETVLDEITPMTAGQLREFAANIPLPRGPALNLPTLPPMLPKPGYIQNSAKYVVGPVGLSKIGSPISAEVVDFDKGAEFVLGQYDTRQGSAKLSLISYPTPAIAAEHLRQIENVYRANQGGLPATATSAAVPYYAKRTGPVVAVVSGSISSGEAKSLLASVNYDASVTWNQNTFFDKKNNLGNLLFNIILLVILILVMAIVAGFAFGGVRIIAKRWFPDRVFDRSRDVDIIRLDIGK